MGQTERQERQENEGQAMTGKRTIRERLTSTAIIIAAAFLLGLTAAAQCGCRQGELVDDLEGRSIAPLAVDVANAPSHGPYWPEWFGYFGPNDPRMKISGAGCHLRGTDTSGAVESDGRGPCDVGFALTWADPPFCDLSDKRIVNIVNQGGIFIDDRFIGTVGYFCLGR